MDTANLFERLLNFTRDGVYRYAFDTGRVLFCNPGFIRLLDLDLTADQVIGKTLSELMAYTEPVGTVRQQLETDGEIHGYEYHFRTLKGEDRWVLHDSFIVDEDGQQVVEAIVKDLTALVKARQAVTEEKERLLVTLRSIGDGVIATDAAGRISMMNKAAEELTGWTQAQGLDRPLAEVFQIINELTGERCEDPVRQVIRSGIVLGLANHTVLVSRSGTHRAIADSAAPIRSATGETIGAVLVFRDASHERKLAEETMRTQKLESIGLLAGGIAHDFNNLLASVLGNISLVRALESADDRCRVPELLEAAEKACLGAKELTGQLLTFAKGGAPVKSMTDLGDIIRDSAAFVLSGSNSRAHFELARDLWFAEVDPAQISQVIQNLVINATEAMPGGGVIKIDARNVTDTESAKGARRLAGPCVEISVADTGMGIPAKYLARIFDPYFSTKQKGSGLGLATTFSIVERHGGRITVDSRMGEGSRFRVWLPAVADAVRRAVPAAIPIMRGAGRILLMDDNRMILDMGEAILRALGYQVECVCDGDQAITCFASACTQGRPFDAVILDLTVPGGMGGREALEKIRQIDPRVKAIVSSGYSNDPIMNDGARHGFAGVLAKPYRVEDLSALLHDVVS